MTQGKQRFESLVTALQDGSLDQTECEEQLLELLRDDTWSVEHTVLLLCLLIMHMHTHTHTHTHTHARALPT